MSAPENTPLGDKTQRLLVRSTGGASPFEWLFRVIIVLALFVSVAVAWWSLTHVLLPRQKLSSDLSTRVSRLSSQVDDMELKWNHSDAMQVSNKIGQLHSELFHGEAALQTWLDGLRSQAEPLGLDLQADFGKTATPATNNLKLAVIPASLGIDVHPSAGVPGEPSPYQRILQFSQDVTGGDQRADLTELTVTAGSNSVRHVVFVLNLWAGEEEAQ